MKIETIVAKDMPEAIQKIRNRLGADAYILHDRKIPVKKWFGLKKGFKVEVFACRGGDMPKSSPASASEPKEHQDIHDHLAKIDSILHRVLQSNDNMMTTLSDYLREQGFTREQALQLAEETFASASTPPEVRSVLKERLLAHLRMQNHTAPIAPESRVVAFVGPTGVGKTTTIAKLAATYVTKGKKVGFITTDTYRIAAIEQLKTYAKILEIPLKVAYKPSELKEAIKDLADRDMIFIDTAGRNYRYESYLGEMQEFLSGISIDETLLVLSLTMKSKDINDIVEVFLDLPADKFVFTKADETDTYGSILNILMAHEKPIGYITAGQNVPEDIEVPSLDEIITMVTEGVE